MSAGEHPSDRLARVALTELGEPGDLRIAALVARHGAAELYRMLCEDRDPDGLLTDVAVRLADCHPDRTLDQAARAGIRFLVPGDPEWPNWIDDLARAEPLQDRGRSPLGLWVRGPVRLDELAGSVAVVGSRSATSYGTDAARDVAGGLARAGRCVVSGAAFGIDQAAHRGALAARGPTVAVLACGVDRVYPAAHRDLLDHLASHGAVVSEVSPGRPPTRYRFLARNRLIAGLCAGTVVVEAAVRSGALNTANWATRLSRPLLGVPGPVTSASSEGVHCLIRSGAAILVTSAAEVLEAVGGAGEHLLDEPRGPAGPRDRLTARQRQVLDAVPVGRGAGTGSIARAAGMGLEEVSLSLDALVSAGLVSTDGDGWRLARLAS